MDAAPRLRSTASTPRGQASGGQFMSDRVAELVRKTRAEQGLPALVGDPAAIYRLATLIHPRYQRGEAHDR